MAKFFTPTKLSENIRKTPEGYLFCLDVPIARTGEMIYGEGETPLECDEDGKVIITRSAKEVFSPFTIASFNGKSVTIKHPMDFVNPQNWAFLTKGTLHNVRKAAEPDEDGEQSLLADVLITDALAISLVDAGLREVSCGYEAEYEQAGVGRGIQTKIVGNHLALVEEGRAGSSYAINDHKGKVTMSKKLGDKIKELLGKTVDEAIKEEKQEKGESSKDESGGLVASERKEGLKVVDMGAYDELVKKVADIGEMLKGMTKGKDDAETEKKDEKAKDEEKEEPKKEEKKAADDEASEDDAGEGEILARVKALEVCMEKMMSKMSGKDEKKDDDKAEDAEEGEEGEKSQKKASDDSEEESEDDDFEESSLTGDAKSKTEDKATGLEGTKNKDIKAQTFDEFDSKKEEMTADKLNELNAAHWARK